MLNALSIDVEDYFHVEAFASHVRPEDWCSFTPRVERNVLRLLEILGDHHVRATFFVLGWVAQRFPGLVRRIADQGHEIGCHSFSHQHLRRMTQVQFREDIHLAKRILSDEAQKPVECFRAPSFSVVQSTLWALDILAEEGFVLDSSIFPVRHDLYGIPDAERFPHWRMTPGGSRLFEFPPSTIRMGNRNLGVAGGGYLRLLPYAFTRWALHRINAKERQPAMVYLHPWEIDPAQPRVRSKFRSRLRHYSNLRTTENKLKGLLKDFSFTTVSSACRQLETYRQSTGMSSA